MSITMVVEMVAKLGQFKVVHLMHRQMTSWPSMKFIVKFCFKGEKQHATWAIA